MGGVRVPGNVRTTRAQMLAGVSGAVLDFQHKRGQKCNNRQLSLQLFRVRASLVQDGGALLGDGAPCRLPEAEMAALIVARRSDAKL